MNYFVVRVVLIAFIILSPSHCNDDLDGVSVEAENNVIDYTDYHELATSLSVECEDHEEYSDCFANPLCQRTCENMDQWESIPCARTKICIHGCVCQDGFVRQYYNGVCVRENSCPRVRH